MAERLNVVELKNHINFMDRIKRGQLTADAKTAASMTVYKLGDIELVVSDIIGSSINSGAKDATSELVRMYRQGREDAFRMAGNWLLPHMVEANRYAKKTLEALER